MLVLWVFFIFSVCYIILWTNRSTLAVLINNVNIKEIINVVIFCKIYTSTMCYITTQVMWWTYTVQIQSILFFSSSCILCENFRKVYKIWSTLTYVRNGPFRYWRCLILQVLKFCGSELLISIKTEQLNTWAFPRALRPNTRIGTVSTNKLVALPCVPP